MTDVKMLCVTESQIRQVIEAGIIERTEHLERQIKELLLENQKLLAEKQELVKVLDCAKRYLDSCYGLELDHYIKHNKEDSIRQDPDLSMLRDMRETLAKIRGASK